MSGKILIVEDDPFTQQFYNYFFTRTGYEIIVTEDGDKIFEILDSEKISLLILDINLKNTYIKNEKTDGIQIAKFIKENDEYKDVPILLVTAYQNKIGTNTFFEENIADDYIIKPINDFNELLQKVDKLKR